jgi:Zn finger protein HypA/HybF involved in hydrogenase expression
MKRSFSIFLVLIALVLLAAPFAGAQQIVSTKKHAGAGVTCVNCHGTNTPKEMASTEACLTCHKSGNGNYYYGQVDAKGDGIEKEYKESGRIRKMAIHDSHQGHVRCTVCHAVHKEPPAKMHCNWCHTIDVKVP